METQYAMNEDRMIAGIAAFRTEQRNTLTTLRQERIAMRGLHQDMTRWQAESQSRVQTRAARANAMREEIDALRAIIARQEHMEDVETRALAGEINALRERARIGESSGTLALLFDAVCTEFDVSRVQLVGGSREQRLVVPRYVLMAVLHARGSSLQRIGMLMGNRHHTTVVNGLQRLPVLRARNPDLDARCARLIQMFTTTAS